jgi:hypothetical protein
MCQGLLTIHIKCFDKPLFPTRQFAPSPLLKADPCPLMLLSGDDTYAANGAIFSARARETQNPAPPVANQN